MYFVVYWSYCYFLCPLDAPIHTKVEINKEHLQHVCMYLCVSVCINLSFFNDQRPTSFDSK